VKRASKRGIAEEIATADRGRRGRRTLVFGHKIPMDDDWTDLVKREMLTRPLTLDEYFAEGMELIRRGRIAQSAIDRDRAQLEARRQAGDEWWEWVMGTEPLMQMGGLALVRDGEVVWARNDWIS
jgi:hypothetical protein